MRRRARIRAWHDRARADDRPRDHRRRRSCSCARGFRMVTQGRPRRELDRAGGDHAAREPARDRARRDAPRRDRPRQAASTSSRSARARPRSSATSRSRADEEEKKRALEQGKDAAARTCRPTRSRVGDPEEATKRATAIAGHHIADQHVRAGDRLDHRRRRSGKGWVARAAAPTRASSSRRSGSSTATRASTQGPGRDLLLPDRHSEKAVIELTDGDEIVQRARLRADRPRRAERRRRSSDVNDHMLRNVMGDKDAKREDRAQ